MTKQRCACPRIVPPESSLSLKRRSAARPIKLRIQQQVEKITMGYCVLQNNGRWYLATACRKRTHLVASEEIIAI